MPTKIGRQLATHAYYIGRYGIEKLFAHPLRLLVDIPEKKNNKNENKTTRTKVAENITNSHSQQFDIITTQSTDI